MAQKSVFLAVPGNLDSHPRLKIHFRQWNTCLLNLVTLLYSRTEHKPWQRKPPEYSSEANVTVLYFVYNIFLYFLCTISIKIGMKCTLMENLIPLSLPSSSYLSLSVSFFLLSSLCLPSSPNSNSTISQDYKAEEDPAKFKSMKTGRGPLSPNWKVQFTSSPPGE